MGDKKKKYISSTLCLTKHVALWKDKLSWCGHILKSDSLSKFTLKGKRIDQWKMAGHEIMYMPLSWVYTRNRCWLGKIEEYHYHYHINIIKQTSTAPLRINSRTRIMIMTIQIIETQSEPSTPLIPNIIRYLQLLWTHQLWKGELVGVPAFILVDIISDAD